jgi:nucleoside-triphosphatase THEP1
METVEQLVTIERRERERRNLERRSRAAHLGTVTPLDRFDWSHPRRIDRALFEKLHGLSFVEAAQNVLFRGPSGVGKTTLAKNLGLAALQRGHSVRFATLAEVLTDLLKQEWAPAIERRMRRYVSPDVLILDEVGYLPCDADAANLVYAIVDRRHEKRATIVTTNLSFKQWGTSPAPPASSPWSTASLSTATSSTSTPTPGASGTPSAATARRPPPRPSQRRVRERCALASDPRSHQCPGRSRLACGGTGHTLSPPWQ